MPPENSRRQAFLIGCALLVGATAFLLIALFLPFGSEGGGGQSGETVQTLSLVHALLAASVLASLPFVLRAVRSSQADPLRPYILRWAMLEGPALFGIVIVLLARMDGDPADLLAYWNLASYALFAAVVVFDLIGLATSVYGQGV